MAIVYLPIDMMTIYRGRVVPTLAICRYTYTMGVVDMLPNGKMDKPSRFILNMGIVVVFTMLFALGVAG